MTRKIKMIVFSLVALLLMQSPAWAVDYRTMSTEELSRLRGSMQSAPQKDRDAFHAEWLNRVNQMTPAERQNYMGPGKGMGSSEISGRPGDLDHGYGSGSGSGMGNSGGMSGGSAGGTGGSGRGSGGGMGSGHGSGNGGGMGGDSGRGGGMGNGGGGMGRGN